MALLLCDISMGRQEQGMTFKFPLGLMIYLEFSHLLLKVVSSMSHEVQSNRKTAHDVLSCSLWQPDLGTTLSELSKHGTQWVAIILRAIRTKMDSGHTCMTYQVSTHCWDAPHSVLLLLKYLLIHLQGWLWFVPHHHVTQLEVLQENITVQTSPHSSLEPLMSTQYMISYPFGMLSNYKHKQ